MTAGISSSVAAASRALPALLDGLTPAPVPDLAVGGIELDSRRVRPGTLFLACRGRRSHGLAHLSQALANGAAAVAFDPQGAGEAWPASTSTVPAIVVERLGERAGVIADRFFGSPSADLAVTGITGTNGKTTVSWLLACARENLGRASGLLGTLGSGRPGALEAGALTTPDAVSVHRELASLRAGGMTSVAMEVSSHALDQHRVAGVRFAAAIFTNLSRDHLDYHGDMASYAKAKTRLFTQCCPQRVILNTDDDHGRRLCGDPALADDLVSVGRRPPPAGRRSGRHLLIDRVERAGSGLTLALAGDFGRMRMRTKLIGDFNVDNAALVLAALLADSVPADAAVAAIGRVGAPPGRMQRVGDSPADPVVVVDYAHTPDALAKALAVLRQQPGSARLICVFGCGGERDPGKRSLMGEAADRLADTIIVTDDNPRGESPEAIVRDILVGIRHCRDVHVEHDRAAAIRRAVAAAGPNDVVLVAGKGHEAWQTRGDVRLPFSDVAHARAALAARGGAAGGHGEGDTGPLGRYP